VRRAEPTPDAAPERTTTEEDVNRKCERRISMSVMMFQAKVKAERVAELEAAARTVFSAVEQVHPEGMRYASAKLSDGVTFVILLGLEEGINNPLNQIPAYREFMGRLKDWLVEPASQEQLTVIGAYNLF
jgi:hypothetical protein